MWKVLGSSGGGGASAVKPATVFREGDVVRVDRKSEVFHGCTGRVTGSEANRGPDAWTVDMLTHGDGHPWEKGGSLYWFDEHDLVLLRRPVSIGDVLRASGHRSTDTMINTDDQTGLNWAACGWAHADGTAIDPPKSKTIYNQDCDAAYSVPKAIVLSKMGDGETIAPPASDAGAERSWPPLFSLHLGIPDDVRLARSLWRTDPDVRALIDEKSDATLCRQTSLVREMVLEGRPLTTYGTYEYATNDAAVARAEDVAWEIDDRGLRTRAEKRAKEIVEDMRGDVGHVRCKRVTPG